MRQKPVTKPANITMAQAQKAVRAYVDRVAMAAELPQSLRVGYLDYTIEDWKPSEAYVNGRYGECDRHHLVIRVRADLPPTRKAETLLHEVLHAAYDMGHVADKDEEEQTVAVLASQLAQIWRDNPDLIRFLEQTFRPA